MYGQCYHAYASAKCNLPSGIHSRSHWLAIVTTVVNLQLEPKRF